MFVKRDFFLLFFAVFPVCLRPTAWAVPCIAFRSTAWFTGFSVYGLAFESDVYLLSSLLPSFESSIDDLCTHLLWGCYLCLGIFFPSSLEQFESWNKIRSLCTAIVLWSYVLLASTTVCGSCICFVQIDHFRASTIFFSFLSSIVKLQKSLKMLFSLMFARTLRLAGHISWCCIFKAGREIFVGDSTFLFILLNHGRVSER